MTTIVFDLDDTICYPNHEVRDSHEKYALARPNTQMIEWMQKIKASGYYIVIHSARRMVTHKGNLLDIERDVGKITRKWLKDHHVPYDELKFGKPYSDTYYVDDKGMDLDQFYKWAEELHGS